MKVWRHFDYMVCVFISFYIYLFIYFYLFILIYFNSFLFFLGYIREILPVPWVLHAKRNWKQSLAMVCMTYDFEFL